MHWFEKLMWGLVHFYADLLTVVGLIGLGACVLHYMMAISDCAERMAKRHEHQN